MAKTKTPAAPEAPAAPAEAAAPAAPASLSGLQVALNGMSASATAITNAIASGKKDEVTLLKIRNNSLHLNHMLGSELVTNAKPDTKAFTDAVEAAKAYLA